MVLGLERHRIITIVLYGVYVLIQVLTLVKKTVKIPHPGWLDAPLLLFFMSWPYGVVLGFEKALPRNTSMGVYWIALVFGGVLVWWTTGFFLRVFPSLLGGGFRLFVTIPIVTFFPLFVLNWFIYVMGLLLGTGEILE